MAESIGYSAMVNEAKKQNAGAIALSEATNDFKSDLASIPSVPYRIEGRTKRLCEEYVETSLKCGDGKLLKTDHPELMVARDLAVARLETVVKPHHSAEKTLFIGATATEVRAYGKNPANSFLIHGTDSKDVERVVTRMAADAGAAVKESWHSSFESDVKRALDVTVKGFNALAKLATRGVAREGSVMRELPEDFRCARVVGRDMLYDCEEKQICDIVEKTKANVAYFTIMAPNEFIDPTVCESSLYRLTEHFPWDNAVKAFEILRGPITVFVETVFPAGLVAEVVEYVTGWLVSHGAKGLLSLAKAVVFDSHPFSAGMALLWDVAKVRDFVKLSRRMYDAVVSEMRHYALTYKNGYSNGYVHREKTWKSWVVKRRFTNGSIVLDSEPVGRYGEMLVLAMYPSSGSSPLVSSLGISKNFETIEILDFTASWVRGTDWVKGKLGPNPTTMRVRNVEFMRLLDWACGEPFERLSLPMLKTATNRLRSGLSINSTEIVRAWETDQDKLTNMCLVVYIEAARNSNLFTEVMGDSKFLAGYRTKIQLLADKVVQLGAVIASGGLAIPLMYLAHWALSTAENIEVVRTKYVPPIRFEERVKAKPFSFEDIEVTFVRESVDPAASEFVCERCAMFEGGRYGAQKAVCKKEKCGKTTFRLTIGEDQVRTLKTELMDAKTFHQSVNAGKVVKIINDAKDYVETYVGGDMSVDLEIEIIEGPPGSGKSVLIREDAEIDMATSNVLITGPFNKLGEDYEEVKLMNGATRTFEYDTTYHAMKHRNKDVIYADETGACNMRMLILTAKLCGARKLVLVGDPGQTLLLPNEGDSAIVSRTLPEDIPRHSLFYIFRTDNAVIAKILNATMGYQVASMSDVYRPIEFKTRAEVPDTMIAELKGTDRKGKPRSVGQYSFSLASSEMWGAATPEEQKTHSIRASQGVTVDDSFVGLCSRDRALIETHGFLTVAISRQRESLTFVAAESVNDPVVVLVKEKLGLLAEGGYEALVNAPWPAVPKPKKRIVAPSASDIKVAALFSDVHLASGAEVPYVERKNVLGEDVSPLWTYEEKQREIRDIEARRSAEVREREEKMKSEAVDVESAWQAGRLVNTCVRDAAWASVEKSQVVPESETAKFDYAWNFIVQNVVEQAVRDKLVVLSGTHVMTTLGLQKTAKTGGRLNVEIGMAMGVFRDAGFSMVVSRGNTYFGDVLEKNVDILIACEKDHATRADRVAFDVWREEMLKMKCGWSLIETDTSVEFGDEETRTLFGKGFGPKSTYVLDSLVEKRFRDPIVRAKNESLGFDVHSLAHELDGTRNFEFTGATCLSDFGTAQGVTADVKPGARLNQDALFFDKTKAGVSVKPRENSFRSLTTGHCLHQTRDPIETLRSASRYIDNENRDTAFSIEGLRLAEKVADEFFDENFESMKLDAVELNTCLMSAHRDAITRKYEGQAVAEKKAMRPLLGLTFFSKAQEKMKTDPFKRGQGIGVPGKRFSMPFMAGFRAHTFAFKKMSRPHFFFDNMQPTEDYLLEVSEALDKTLDSSFGMSAKVDHVEFDRKQGWWTRAVERRFFVRLGVPADWIDEYQQCRESVKGIAFGLFKATFNGKFSGFFDTLLGNTIVGGATGDYSVRGKGAKVVCGKGDDMLKVQSALVVREKEKKDVEHFSNMKIVVQIDDAVEFCGLAGSASGLVPDLFRLGLKACAKRFRDYHAFCQWQISARDTECLVTRFGLARCIQQTCGATGRSVSQVETSYGIFLAMAHWSKAQFEGNTKVGIEKRGVMPAADGSCSLKI